MGRLLRTVCLSRNVWAGAELRQNEEDDGDEIHWDAHGDVAALSEIFPGSAGIRP